MYTGRRIEILSNVADSSDVVKCLLNILTLVKGLSWLVLMGVHGHTFSWENFRAVVA